ncbi:MAG TPA: tol-pal system protein YbgF [bacterium]|nr:tol-pal system protein YbgF [bacterium]
MSRWLVLVVFLLLFGCATAEDVRILDGEIYRLQSQLNGIQKEKETNRNELIAFQREIQKGISILQAETQRVQSEAQRIRADLLLQKETLQSEMQTLSTGVEEYKEFLKRPSKEIDRVKEDMLPRVKLLEEKGKANEERGKVLEDRSRVLDERMKRVEDRFKGLEAKIGGLEAKIGGLEAKIGGLEAKTGGLEAKIGEMVSKPMEGERAALVKERESIPETRGVPTGVGDLYRDAYETFQRGNLEEARRRFEAFLKQYPNTELSDNAQFWIGETYYLKKDYEKAILEYEKAITKYPEGDKISAALFKQALAFSELGDKTNARSLLRKLIERYPHSDQAEMAKKRLETIK